MQSYRSDESANAAGPSSIAASFVPGPQNGIQNAPSRTDDSMNRYKSMYEERMNPFEAFRGRVSFFLEVFEIQRQDMTHFICLHV